MPKSSKSFGTVPAVAAGRATATDAGEMAPVESKTMVFRDVRLEGGATLAELRLAYETYGALDAGGRNAILVTHGYTGSHHAAGHYAPGHAPAGIAEDVAGWWDNLIGPGKAIDTDRFFVVSSNMLGSSYGSTGPASLDPRTGKPYGPDFPHITLTDIVSAQKRLLAELGIGHLVAVAGPSYGGYQAFQWAVTFPDFMDGVVAAASAPKGDGGDNAVRDLVAALARDPNWNGGWYYDRGGISGGLTAMRIATLKRYGVEQSLAARFPDPAERAQAIRKLAEPWARAFDGNSLVTLRRAAVAYDAEKDFARIKARLLYVLSTTDQLFPPTISPGVMAKLKAAGVDATYFELESQNGHLAPNSDWAKWAPTLKGFIESVA